MKNLINKTVDEAVEYLAGRYAEVQNTKQAELNISPEARNALIGGLAGAGIGGLGSLGYNYLKNRRLSLLDALYGGLAGAIPGASIGYLSSPRSIAPSEAKADKPDQPADPKQQAAPDTKEQATAKTPTSDKASVKAEDERLGAGARAIAGLTGAGVGAKYVAPGLQAGTDYLGGMLPTIPRMDPNVAPDIKRVNREIADIKKSNIPEFDVATKARTENITEQKAKDMLLQDRANKLNKATRELKKYERMAIPEQARLYGLKYMPKGTTVDKGKAALKGSTRIVGGIAAPAFLADWLLRRSGIITPESNP